MITATERAKQLGANSLEQVAKEWDCTIQNLYAKFKTNQKQFDIIVLGVVVMERMNQRQRIVRDLQLGSFDEDIHGEQMI